MLHVKSKIFSITVVIGLISALLTPALTQANTDIVLAASDTGEIAASQAADQKARLAKKAADRQKAAEEKKAAEEAQKAAETPKTQEVTK